MSAGLARGKGRTENPRVYVGCLPCHQRRWVADLEHAGVWTETHWKRSHAGTVNSDCSPPACSGDPRRPKRKGEREAGEGMTPERLLNARELGEILGFQAGTIVDWAEAGKVPAFRIGGRLRFRESEVLSWLEQHRQGSLTDTDTGSYCPKRQISLTEDG
jgi:excisionase family DNA binding protein